MKMAKREWLYCGDDWTDIVNIIKLEKNLTKRVREFHDIIEREGLTVGDATVGDAYPTWRLFKREEIEGCTEEWFYDNDYYALMDDTTLGNNKVTYWFFNIRTGEAMRIGYSMQITCSGIVTV